ncbi:jg25785, partial [Pararge aegeria aegeria]
MPPLWNTFLLKHQHALALGRGHFSTEKVELVCSPTVVLPKCKNKTRLSQSWSWSCANTPGLGLGLGLA